MKKKNKGKGCVVFIAVFFILAIIGSLLPESENDIYEEAVSKYNFSEYREALQLINKAINTDSANTEFYELRGKILYELQDTLHSEEDFKRTVLLAKTDSIKDIRIKELINWDLQHGDKEKIKELLKEELQLYKNDSTKHVAIMEYAADTYLAINDTLETIHIYTKLSNEYSQTGRFNNKIGVLYSQMHKDKAALKAFGKAVKAAPDNDIFLYNLGITYLHLKNKRKAKLYLKKATDLGNKDACNQYRELTARTRYYQLTQCCDGTTSSSTGRGTCSHHGGVCGVVNIPYKEYTFDCY
ncbi:MAG: hypothetical protein AAF611_03515 [Bacteroidota bacterium]